MAKRADSRLKWLLEELTPLNPTRFERYGAAFLVAFVCFALLNFAFLIAVAFLSAVGVV